MPEGPLPPSSYPRAILVTATVSIRVSIANSRQGDGQDRLCCPTLQTPPIQPRSLSSTLFPRACRGPPCHLLSAAPAVPALANVSQPCRQSTSREGRQCRSEHQSVSLSCSHTAWCQQAIHSTYSFPGLAHLEISISAYLGRKPK